MSDKNIYTRLLEMRTEFHCREVRKSGYNDYSNYAYYELSDIVPHVIELAPKHGVCPIISYNQELATLTLVNVDNPLEQITVSSPLGSAKLKASHDIQNVGAVQTYQRRYLYLALLDVVETEDIDSRPPAQQKAPGSSQKPPGRKPANSPQGNHKPAALKGSPKWTQGYNVCQAVLQNKVFTEADRKQFSEDAKTLDENQMAARAEMLKDELKSRNQTAQHQGNTGQPAKQQGFQDDYPEDIY